MMTKAELLLLPKGESYPIEWDKSKIVELLIRKKKVGVWGFYLYNLISKKTYLLAKNYQTYNFTIRTGNEMIKVGQLVPKNFNFKK